MHNSANDVYIGVGSNINPEINIKKALIMLGSKENILNISTFYKTKPLKNRNQPDYLNGVWKISTNTSPHQLKFDVLHSIENQLNRKRTKDKYASRTIDLDILLYGNLIIKQNDLTIPDPDITERPFIYLPLYELNPNLIIYGKNIAVKDIAEDYKHNETMFANHIFSDILKRKLNSLKI